MAEAPENVPLIIKKTTPMTPEKSYNIKERLNLHVKRRQQQEPTVVDLDETSKRKEKQKETQKVRRYQKRTEKAILQACVDSETNRKYKRNKIKELGGTKATTCHNSGALSDDSFIIATPLPPNGDDEGSHDGAETKGVSGRDKDKCADILGMVMNVKKKTLMQTAEVQEFLCKVMNAIKS